MRNKRHLSIAIVVLVILAGLGLWTRGQGEAGENGDGTTAQAAVALPPVLVYKSPTCGCCSSWVEHMQDAGFPVKVKEVNDVAPVKDKYGVPTRLRSCHTAIVDGYVIEGHVPADVVERLLQERPDVAGLAVPGMVAGSPGMEGGRAQSYDVVAFDREGNTSVYASR